VSLAHFELAVAHLRILQHLFDVVDRTARNARGVESLDPFERRPGAKQGIELRGEFVAAPHPVRTREETRIGRQFRCAHGLAQVLELHVVADGDGH